MKLRSFALFTSFFAFSVLANGQVDNVPSLKSNDGKLNMQVDGGRKSQWALSWEPGRPDEFVEEERLSVFYGRKVKFVFSTDAGSIDFEVEGGKSYDLIVKHGDMQAKVRITGVAYGADDLAPYHISQSIKRDSRPELVGGAMGFHPYETKPGGLSLASDLTSEVLGCKLCFDKVDLVVIDYLPLSLSHWFERQSTRQFKPRIRKIFDNVSSGLSLALGSVDAFWIKTPGHLDDPDVLNAVRKAEVVLFNSSLCLPSRSLSDSFLQSKLAAAIGEVYVRGGGVGGDGAATLLRSPSVNKCRDSGVSVPTGLLDPRALEILSPSGALTRSPLPNTSVSTIRNVNKPEGELEQAFVLIARQIQEKGLAAYNAVVIADQTARVMVGKTGVAKVAGRGAAYFIIGDHRPEVCEKGKPLTFSNFKVWKLEQGASFDFKNPPKTGLYTVSVTEGKLDRDPYSNQ